VGVAGLITDGMAGRAKAFLLQLQAQQALCQVQIEKNTRSAASERAA
jgi:hypothetical protein